MPQGNLTSTQYEIMPIVWDHGAEGATVSGIWQDIAVERTVARTTVLNLVDRLEKQGWLIRQTGNGANRYVAAKGREETARVLARDFVDNFFGGSASQLVMSRSRGKTSRGRRSRTPTALASATPRHRPSRQGDETMMPLNGFLVGPGTSCAADQHVLRQVSTQQTTAKRPAVCQLPCRGVPKSFPLYP